VSSAPAMKVLKETQFAGLVPSARGKVRDIYDLGDKLLIVATDRLSAFDVILPTPIPDKGCVLTQLSLFWFELLKDVILNHVLSTTDFPAPFNKFKGELAGRSMIVRKTQPLPIECVVRGYVSGSAWKDYRAAGKICGIALPAGLRESDRLLEPILPPPQKRPPATTKTFLLNRQPHSSAKNVPKKFAPSAWKSTAVLPLTPNPAGSFLPTRNSNLA
jgi:phosphoribosylaminoimidazole-succinocarboxamide synthase